MSGKQARVRSSQGQHIYPLLCRRADLFGARHSFFIIFFIPSRFDISRMNAGPCTRHATISSLPQSLLPYKNLLLPCLLLTCDPLCSDSWPGAGGDKDSVSVAASPMKMSPCLPITFNNGSGRAQPRWPLSDPDKMLIGFLCDFQKDVSGFSYNGVLFSH